MFCPVCCLLDPVRHCDHLDEEEGAGYFTFLSFLGSAVQSVVSSLRVVSLTDLADSIYSILIFFAEKM